MASRILDLMSEIDNRYDLVHRSLSDRMGIDLSEIKKKKKKKNDLDSDSDDEDVKPPPAKAKKASPKKAAGGGSGGSKKSKADPGGYSDMSSDEDEVMSNYSGIGKLSTTGWGGHLFRRLCKLFSESSTGCWAILQLPCCPSKQGNP